MSGGISNVLREYVLKEKKSNPSLNESALSKKMDIPSTTFNRLMNGYSRPNLVTTLKLLQFIPELRHHLPKELAKMLEVTLSRKDSGFVGADLESLLYEKYNFLCWALASTKGVTKEDIRNLFGTQGVKSLQLLEKNKILSKDQDGRYRVVEKTKDTVLAFPLVKNHVMHLVEQYQTRVSGGSYIHYEVENLSEEGVREIIEIQKQAHKRIQQTMRKYKGGGIPVFALGCCDLFMENVSPKNQEGVK